MAEALNQLPPVGAVVRRDGPVVRTHYGTHGEVSHGPLPEGDLEALVSRQVEAFARRNEPVVWPVYGDGLLAEVLLAAGFAASRNVRYSAVRSGRTPRRSPCSATAGPGTSGSRSRPRRRVRTTARTPSSSPTRPT